MPIGGFCSLSNLAYRIVLRAIPDGHFKGKRNDVDRVHEIFSFTEENMKDLTKPINFPKKFFKKFLTERSWRKKLPKRAFDVALKSTMSRYHRY